MLLSSRQSFGGDGGGWGGGPGEGGERWRGGVGEDGEQWRGGVGEGGERWRGGVGEGGKWRTAAALPVVGWSHSVGVRRREEMTERKRRRECKD